MESLEFIPSHILSLPALLKFAVGMALIIAIPRLWRRVGIPGAVGLLLSGVVFGLHVLDLFREQRTIADFFADLENLLLMSFARLAVTVVAYNTVDPAGQRLLDGRMLNAVLVLMVTSSILGPIPTLRFAPLILKPSLDELCWLSRPAGTRLVTTISH